MPGSIDVGAMLKRCEDAVRSLPSRWPAFRGWLARERVRIGLTVIILELLVVAFHLLGNTVENVHSRSVFVWTMARWGDAISFGADYSIGYLLPFVSLGVVLYRWPRLMAAPKRLFRPGLAVLVGALAFHWIGARMQQTRLSLLSLIALLWSIPLYLYGPNVGRLLLFPCAYLVLCIPLNFLDAFTFPLRLFSTAIAAGLLNGLGVPVARSGSVIRSLQEGGFDFNVADPCSGLRSLLAMSALTAVYACFTQKTLVRQWLLFLGSIPLAIVGNIVRIVTVAVVARFFGEKLALTLYHDYSGYLVFTVAILLMIGAGSFLNSFRMENLLAWTRAKPGHT